MLQKKANSAKQRGIAKDDSYIPGAPKLSKRFPIEAHLTESSMPELSTGLVPAVSV